MAFVTATRPGAGAYLPQFVHAVEKRVQETVDLRAKQIPVIAMLEALGLMQPEDAPYAKLLPNITENNTPVTPYGYGVTPPIYYGGYAGTGRVEYATYLAPVGFELEDEIRGLTGPDAVIDLANLRWYNAMRAQGENLEVDIVGGNGSNALRMTGLEQWISAASQVASVDTLAEILVADDWNFRQCTSTVQGLARTAMTGPGTGGVRLLNNTCIDFSDIGASAGSRRFDVSSGVLNDNCKIFEYFYDITCSGADYPDLIWSTTDALGDARRAGQAFVSFVVNQSEGASANIGPGGVKYGAATWYALPTLKATGLNASLTAGESMIYLINSDHLRVEIDRERFLSPVYPEWQPSHSPIGWFQQFQLRCQMVMDAPGFHGVVKKYGT